MYLFAVLVVFLLVPNMAGAVLPPDMIFSVGAQLWQILAGVGALLVGTVTALFPFLRNTVAGIPRLRVILLSLGSFFILCGLSYLFYVSTVQEAAHLPAPVSQVPSGVGLPFAFYSDRFVFSGHHANGNSILIDLTINRKQEADGSFTHYYLGDIIDGTKQNKISLDRAVWGHEVLPDLFFSAFTHATSTDHSARENFTMNFDQLGKSYALTTGELVADFITKNEPEYTAYIGASTSSLSVGKERIVMNTMHERVYSTDYRQTIFFEGGETLPSTTVQLVFWDDVGNFYLIDKSDVRAPSPAYSSHYWALMKDKRGYVKRAFGGEARIEQTSTSTRFIAHVPGLSEASLVLPLVRPFVEAKDKGLVLGSIEDALGVRNVEGEGYFNTYGKE